MSRPEDMWQCQTINCGYIYDPDRGDRKGKIPKGTRFEDLPDDWKCPVCGAGKSMFRPLAGPGSVMERDKQETVAPQADAGPKYRCNVCGYIYDPAVGDASQGVAPGTAFEALPENWKCPVCGASKEEFEEI
ncbi:MAG: rubredoxin [Deltaproteobacteria bacterium]|nr:rubredoxin [Deltaproteobacteria bacterium]